MELFVPIRRLPGFLRPGWLPPEWRASGFKEHGAGAIASLASPVDDQPPPGRKPRARWEVIHVDDDPATPCLYVMRPGWRFGHLYVYDDLAVFVQHRREDRHRGAPFVSVLTPREVNRLTFIPTPPTPWWTVPKHFPIPRLILDTTSGPHHLAATSWRFRGNVEEHLQLLSEVLRVPVFRPVG